MNNVIYRKGDVISAFINSDVDVFAHGCNCMGVMGSGVAKQVRIFLPFMYRVYMDRHNTVGLTLGDMSYVFTGFNWGFNLNTQLGFGTDKRQVDYDAVEASARLMVNQIKRDMYISRHKSLSEITIGIPRIGAGLGGGNWNTIIEILARQWSEFKKVVVYEFE